MGEAKRRKSATERLIERYPDCALCGGNRRTATRDHIPPVAMFNNSHRPNDLVIPACKECNGGSRTADLVVSIVSRWRYTHNAKELIDHNHLVTRLKSQAPEVIAEWTNTNGISRALAGGHLTKQGVYVPNNYGLALIGPQTIPFLNLFSYKLVLGLYFAKMGSALRACGAVTAYWRTKEDFQIGALPRELTELFDQHGTLAQGNWTEKDTFEYRFVINQEEELFGCIVRCRMFFIVGFASGQRSTLGALDSHDWLSPPDVLGILKDPRFKKRAQ